MQIYTRGHTHSMAPTGRLKNKSYKISFCNAVKSCAMRLACVCLGGGSTTVALMDTVIRIIIIPYLYSTRY
ncbi:hypothetical protein XELAEV_18013974mg [Xenopus laevis]|uniref:Uncharacterized protein n=1 Tax=Xenopus laevis TaxID=8355 RepID=A0A974DQS8_XENLA|nr:hypothetical protein XELAEV_18013974mg [Xenopus laevis]